MVKTTYHRQAVKMFVEDFILYLKKEHKVPVKGAYLFGSYAKNKQTAWSDIDVAVVSEMFRGTVDPYVYLFLKKRKIDVQRGIEAVGFHPEEFVRENPFANEIMRSGVKIA